MNPKKSRTRSVFLTSEAVGRTARQIEAERVNREYDLMMRQLEERRKLREDEERKRKDAKEGYQKLKEDLDKLKKHQVKLLEQDIQETEKLTKVQNDPEVPFYLRGGGRKPLVKHVDFSKYSFEDLVYAPILQRALELERILQQNNQQVQNYRNPRVLSTQMVDTVTGDVRPMYVTEDGLYHEDLVSANKQQKSIDDQIALDTLLPKKRQLQAELNKLKTLRQNTVHNTPGVFVGGDNSQYDQAINKLSNDLLNTNRDIAKIVDPEINLTIVDAKKQLEDTKKKFDLAVKAGAGNRTGQALNAYMLYVGTSPEFAGYRSQISDLEKTIADLETVRDLKDYDRWYDYSIRGVKDTLNHRTWDFGVSSLVDATDKMYLSSKQHRGEKLSDVEKDALKASFNQHYAEGLLDETGGHAYKFGRIAGESAPYMLDFLLMSGVGVGMESTGRGVARLLANNVSRAAARAYLKNTGLRAAGIIGESVAKSALTSNTIQAAKTAADVMNRYTGNPEINPETGDIEFKSDETFLSALYKGEANSIVENFTEMIGAHLNVGGWLKGGIDFAAKKGIKGAAATSKFLEKMSANLFYKGANGVFKKMGVHDFGGEVLEEEINIPLNALFVGDQTMSLGFSLDNQIDILGGMALSIGPMKMAALGGAGINYATGYQAFKKAEANVNKSAERAKALIGGDRWKLIKTSLDQALNSNIAGVMQNIMHDTTLSNDQKGAVANYYFNLMKMRGENIARQKLAPTLAGAAAGAAAGSAVMPGVGTAVGAALGAIGGLKSASGRVGFNEFKGTGALGEALKRFSDAVKQNEEMAAAQGYNAVGRQKNDILNRYEYAKTTLMLALGIQDDTELFKFIQDEKRTKDWLSDQFKAGAINEQYLNAYDHFKLAKAAYDSMLQAVDDNTDVQIAGNDAWVDTRTHTDGTLKPATLKDGSQVHIVSGNIQTDTNGKIALTQKDKVVRVVDKFGSIISVPTSNITSVGTTENAETRKRQDADAIRQYNDDKEHGVIYGLLQFNEGDSFHILGEDGLLHAAQIERMPEQEKDEDGNGRHQYWHDNYTAITVDGGNEVQFLPKDKLLRMYDGALKKRLQASVNSYKKKSVRDQSTNYQGYASEYLDSQYKNRSNNAKARAEKQLNYSKANMVDRLFADGYSFQSNRRNPRAEKDGKQISLTRELVEYGKWLEKNKSREDVGNNINEHLNIPELPSRKANQPELQDEGKLLAGEEREYGDVLGNMEVGDDFMSRREVSPSEPRKSNRNSSSERSPMYRKREEEPAKKEYQKPEVTVKKKKKEYVAPETKVTPKPAEDPKKKYLKPESNKRSTTFDDEEFVNKLFSSILSLIDLDNRVTREKYKNIILSKLGDGWDIVRKDGKYRIVRKIELQAPIAPTIEGRGENLPEPQRQTLEKLNKKQVDDSENVLRQYTTGHDYFIIGEDGKIHMVPRVHTAIGDSFTKSSKYKNDYKIWKKRLIKAWDDAIENSASYQDAIDKFKLYVIGWQDAINNAYKATYGEASQVTSRNVQNYNGYFLPDVLTQDSIGDVIEALSSILATVVDINRNDGAAYPSPISSSVIGGGIVDELARDYFETGSLEYDPMYDSAYGMSQDIFNQLITIFENYRKLFAEKGYILKTVGYLWHTLFENGISVAGETDMIAISPEGKVTIIDFKTSSSARNPFAKYLKVLPGGKVAETSIFESDKPTFFRGTENEKSAVRTTKELYEMQQTMYANMIVRELGALVEDTYIMAFWLGHQLKDGLPKAEYGRFTMIRDAGLIPLESSETVNNMINSHYEAPDTDIDGLNSMSDYLAGDVLEQQIWARNHPDANSLILLTISAFADRAQRLFDQYIDPALSSNDANKHAEARQKIRDLYEEFEQIQEQALHDQKDEAEAERDKGVIAKGIAHRTRITGFGGLANHNAITWEAAKSSFSSKKEHEDFIDTISQKDFITESTITAYIDDSGRLALRIRYKDKVFDRVFFSEAKKATSKFDYTGIPSQIRQILENNPGKELILNAYRTNGLIMFSPDYKSVVESGLISEEQLINSLDGDTFGVVVYEGNGRRVYVRSIKTGKELYTFRGKNPPANGSLMQVHDCGYTEDNDFDGYHTVEVVMHTNSYTESDVELIVSILSDVANRRKDLDSSTFEFSDGQGNTYQLECSPRQILQSLIRFGAGAKHNNAVFEFDFVKGTRSSVAIIDHFTGTDYTEFDLTEDENGFSAGQDALRQTLLQLFNPDGEAKFTPGHDIETMSQTSIDLQSNIFTAAKKFFREVKPETGVDELKLSDHVSFKRSDFDNDTESHGFSGLEWTLRNRVSTNFNGVHNPVVSIDMADGTQFYSEHKQTAEEKASEEAARNVAEDGLREVRTGEVEIAKDEKPATASVYEEPIDSDDDVIFSDNMYASFDKQAEHESETPINTEKAKKELKEMFGEDFPVEILDTAIETMKSGKMVVGRCYADSILLFRGAKEGVQYHEAFHRVVEFLIPESRRKKLYDSVRKKYPSLTDEQIAEFLADQFMEFRQGLPVVRFSSNVIDTIKSVYNWVKAWANIGDLKLIYLYSQVNRGKFRNVKPTKEALARAAKYKEGYNFTVDIDGKSINLENFINTAEYNHAMDMAVYNTVFRQSDGNVVANYDSINLDLDHVKRIGQVEEGLTSSNFFKALTGEDLKESERSDSQKKYNEIFQHWDELQSDVNARLERLGLNGHYKKLKQLREDQEAGEVLSVGTTLQEHIAESYEFDKLDSVNELVRVFLSTIPLKRWATEQDVKDGLATSIEDEDGNRVSVHSEHIDVGGKKVGVFNFMPFREVASLLMNYCHDIESVADLDNRLSYLQNIHPAFLEIRKRFHSALEKSVLPHSDTIEILGEDGKYVKVNSYAYAVRGGKLFKRNGKKLIPIDKKYKIQKHPDIPRVFLNNKELEVGTYTVDKETWTVYDNNGDVIEDAFVVVNFDNEQFVTSLYQAVKSNKLNPTFTFAVKRTDENGKATFSYKVSNADESKSQRLYPMKWFGNLKSGLTGVFEVSKQSKLQFVRGQENVFKDTVKVLDEMKSVFGSEKGGGYNNFTIPGESKLDFRKYSAQDKLIEYFVKTVNKVGIGMTVDSFKYFLTMRYPNKSVFEAFTDFMKEPKSSDYSISRLSDTLSNIDKKLKDGDASILTKNFNGYLSEAKDSGHFLFSKNALIKNLAISHGEYVGLYQKHSVEGPGGNKMYVMTQNHTISDNIGAIKNTLISVNNGQIEVSGSQYAKDMTSTPYNVFIDANGVARGSLISKHLMKEGHAPFKLDTELGLNLQGSATQGTKFTEINKREDFLCKAAKLLTNHIIFPTLSDKGTWFFLKARGFRLPGLDFSKPETLKSMLPGNEASGGYLRFDEKDTVDNYAKNEVLDQLIEYFYTEYELIKDEMEKIDKIPESQKVKHWHKGTKLCPYPHSIMFSSFVGMYKNDGTYVSFNNIHHDPYYNLKNAEKLFFGDHITDGQRRAIVARMLQSQLDDSLQFCVENGILKKRAGAEGYFAYANIMLDNDLLEPLVKLALSTKSDDITNSEARSMAIVSMLMDINAKTIMSTQETERWFTGHPGFFKWEYNKDGELVDRSADETKRLGGAGSTGMNNRSDLPNIKLDYVCAEIKDWEVGSSVSNYLRQGFEDNEYRMAYYDMLVANSDGSHLAQTRIYNEVYKGTVENPKPTLEFIKSQLSEDARNLVLASIDAEAGSFVKGINVADGSAYITDKMAENLLRQRGAYNNEIAKAFAFLRGEAKYKGEDGNLHTVDVLQSSKAYEVIHNALISNQKYSAFGHRMMGNMPIHYYNKFALFPLFENMSHGFMNDVYQKMKEQGVDMLMFDSAVKAGSQGALDFNPTMSAELLANFKFNTYVQKYSGIRRQLNTDPRISEEMHVGTQAIKVALSNLMLYRDDYTGVDGKKCTGVELRNQIMSAINHLSDFGARRISEKFFTGGEVDIEKFGKFVKEQLVGRDADKNILEGLEVITDSEGKKKFKYPLAAMSSINWIQSILTSYIDGEVVDVNLPGNAYYQRSIFGMDDAPVGVISDDKIKSKTLNDGKPLRMINEEGSMDAMISYDYLMHLVPKHVRHNFTAGRQWLIDNGIIGPKATANTMSYRIPTQAQSSIHALRFVDVLPVVRDTIVLPKEFTKITGSDFDIDKLYISTYPFKLVAKDKLTGEIVEKQQRGVEYDFEIQKEFEQGTEDYYKAGLVNAYLQLLKDGGKYDETKPEGEQFEVGATIQVNQRSIDNDTELIDGVLEELESNRVVPTYKPFKYDSLHTQVNTKQSFMVGKVGIGPFALNNNSLILTTIYEVEFKHDDFSVMTALNLNSLHNKKDQDGKSILSWLSALINVHVDVAKDPKIARLNVNKYTYNLTNVLIRTGLGKRTFYFLKQPIVELMAQEFDAAGGELTLSSESPSKRLEDAVSALVLAGSGNLKFNDTLCNLIKDYSECRNNIDWREIRSGRYSLRTAEAVEKLTFIQRVAVDLFNQENNILKDIITNPNALKDPSKGVSIDNLKDDESFTYDVAGQKMTPLEVQAYVVVIKNQFDVYSRMMADLVAVTKIDTKKEGKTYSEQKEYMDRYDKFLRDGLKHFTESIYDMMGVTVREVDEKSHEVTKLEDDPYISFINHKTERATNALLKLLESQILPASGKFDTVRTRIINKTRGYGQEFKQKVDLAIVSFIKAKYFQEYIKQNNINARSLFVTEYSEDGSTVISKNISDRVNELVYRIENDTTGKYSKYQRNGQVSNALLKMLVTDLYDHKDGVDNPEFMLLSTEDAEDSFSSNDVINGWQQMLESDDEEIKKLAEDLIIYSFLTSGGQSGRSKFFNYVPLSWLTQKHNVFDGMSFAEYMEASLNDANSQDTQAPFFDITDDDIDDIITNNWMDNDFCPVITDQQTLTGVRLNIPSSKFKEPFGVFAPVEERQEADGRKRSILNKVITSYGGQEFPSVVKICTNGERSSNPHDWLVYKKIGEGLANDGTRYPIYALTYPKSVKTKATNTYQLYEYATDKFGIGMNYYVPLAWYAAATIPDRLERNAKAIADHIAEGGKLETAPMEISNPAYQYIASSFYKANSAKIAAKENLKESQKLAFDASEYTNHSGGAYGGDTMWDQIGRRYGVINHNHYRDEGNTSLSKTLRDAGVKATVLTKEQMEFARQKVKELLGKEYPNTTEGNLLVRNFYQVYNADAVFAIGTINSNSSVTGGTNTAVQLGIKLLKPTYVFNLKDNQWYLYSELEGFVQTETPTLTKNFAGVGTRDIQLYKKRDADGNWVDNPKYLGDAAKQAAYNAVKAVYEKTFGKQSESQALQPTVQQTIDVKFDNEDLWSALSNFAERKFTLDVSIGGLKQPITFSSVEGAFQAMKLFYSPIGLTKETVAQFQSLAAYSAQRAGRAILGLDIARWDRNKEAILKKVMLESFKQNAAAAELLLSTGNATITHSVGGDYATLFPKLLMEIRAELQRERDEAVETGKPVIESENTILGTEEARLWNENGVSDDNPRILVASEHTDAVLHSHEIVEMLKGNRPIISHRTLDGKFSPKGVEIPVEEFNGLYLMTKHDGLPLRRILEATDKRGRKIPKIIHFSITGYGGTEWEPGVMKPDDMLDCIQSLIDEKLLDPKWVTVRIDPIIPGHFDKKMTKHIIDRAKAMGIRRFRISVMDFYDQIGNPQIDPATGEDTRPNVMKNYDWDQYYGRKSNSTIDWMNGKEAERIVNMSRFKLGRQVSREEADRWIKEFHESGVINDEAKKMGVKFHPYGEFNKNAKQSYVDEVFNWFDNLAAEDQSISIGSCAEAAVKNYPNITPEGCLSVASVNAMLGTHIQEKGTDNNKLRKECSCFGNKTDMLAYSDACASSCTYCYAKQNTTKPLTYYEADGTLKRNGLTVTSVELLKSDNTEQRPQLVLTQTLTSNDNLITVTSTDGRTITYNKEQSDAIRNATDFLLNGSPSEYYVIEGKAGTGKTTIAKEVIRRYKEKNPFDRLLIGALSNKATFVIKNSFKGFDVPGITPDTFKTTAGMLGMKLDQETGQFVQDRSNFKKKFPILKADLIVIDEASMMNEDNIKMVMSMKKPSAKVLFLGDIGQLPPIRPADSPNQNSKSEVFASSNKSSLVTRVRQGEANPILPFADHFWNNNTSSDNAVLDPVPASAKKNLIKGTSGNLLFADDIENLSQQIVKLFLRGIDMADVNYAKIVVYTNAKRQLLNSYLHKQLFGNTDLNIDEPMIAQSPVMDFDIYEERERTIITTSDEFVITNIGKPEISDYGVETQLITAVLSSEQRSERPSKKIFRVVTRQGMDDYNRVSDMLLTKAKATVRGSRDSAMAWKEFYKFKAIHNTMNYNQRGGSNIDYGYAITSHKSQGSTYTAVIVDADDIMSVGATSSRNKSESIYTALTRPKNTAIYIDPSVDNATRNETCSMDIAKLVKDSTPIQLSEQQQRLAEEDMNNCKGK